MKQLLNSPALYQSFQVLGGFFGARVIAVTEYLNLKPGDHVIDIGCGPGFIVDHLTAGVHYDGFDIDARYIDYAKRRFGNHGAFRCRIFDEAAAGGVEAADVVMMNGLIHHLDDASARAVLGTASKALKPNGVVLTLDGCYRDGQSSIARWFLDHDRGRFVRTQDEYRALARDAFKDVEIIVREDMSWLPYTFAIGLMRGRAGSCGAVRLRG
jgi:SAM-dependent methyltransferase